MSGPATIGIVGAGKLGIVLAQLCLRAGYEVYISGSGDPSKIALSIEVLAPGAKAVTTEKLAKKAGLVMLAIPLRNFRYIDSGLFSGKIVVDAMNYWPAVDRELSDIIPGEMSQSEEVQRYFASARVIKALNHMGYHHLLDEARPRGASRRKAIAIAGNDHEGVVVVAQVVDAIGFDALVIGDLASGRALETGMPAFGANTTESELKKLARP